jgi:hypothetical protein
MVGSVILIGTFAESRIERFGPEVVRAARRISVRLGAEAARIFARQNGGAKGRCAG